MDSVVEFFFPHELLLVLVLFIAALTLAGIMAAKAAAKVCTPENGKKLAVGTAKVAGKTAGKVVARAAWNMFKNRVGM